MSTYYFLPTRNVFGMGASQEAGELMRSLGGPASPDLTPVMRVTAAPPA